MIQLARRRHLLQLLTAMGATTGGLLPLPLFAHTSQPLTIGVIYVGTKDDYGYTQAQAQAVAEIKSMPGIRVVEEENVAETVAAQKAMTGMIRQDGAKLIIATSFGYFDPHVLAVAKKNPAVQFAHCGGLLLPDMPANIGSYFGYIEECQYLNGVLAGYMSQSKKIAFIAAKPVAQVLRNINAFTLGARSVHPEITCSVVFTGDWSLPVKEAEATNSLVDQGCDVFSMHVDSPKVIIETVAKRGKLVCGYHTNQSRPAPAAYLSGSEWQWSTPLKKMVEAARQSQPLPRLLRGGLQDQFVTISPYGKAVSEAAREQVATIQAQMLAGTFSIFKNGLRDNTGAVRVAEGVALGQRDIELETMNYLVEGVIGKIS